MQFELIKKEGQVALLQPRTPEAEQWLQTHLESNMRLNGAVVLLNGEVKKVVQTLREQGAEVVGL